MGIKVENTTFQCNGYRLKGRTYRPAGNGKHPAVAICHGYPGDTKNIDLAEELALNGIAVLVFYYQGSMGQPRYIQFLKPGHQHRVRS